MPRVLPGSVALLARIWIHSTDVARITGKSLRTAERYLREVRRHYPTPKPRAVLVSEFCAVYGYTIEEVAHQIPPEPELVKAAQ